MRMCRSQARRRKGCSVEKCISHLREVEGHPSQGQSILQAVRVIGVTEKTCYRWRYTLDFYVKITD